MGYVISEDCVMSKSCFLGDDVKGFLKQTALDYAVDYSIVEKAYFNNIKNTAEMYDELEAYIINRRNSMK